MMPYSHVISLEFCTEVYLFLFVCFILFLFLFVCFSFLMWFRQELHMLQCYPWAGLIQSHILSSSFTKQGSWKGRKYCRSLSEIKFDFWLLLLVIIIIVFFYFCCVVALQLMMTFLTGWIFVSYWFLFVWKKSVTRVLSCFVWLKSVLLIFCVFWNLLLVCFVLFVCLGQMVHLLGTINILLIHLLTRKMVFILVNAAV